MAWCDWGGPGYWCQECVVAGVWVSYERAVRSFGAMCELYEERRLFVTRVVWGRMTFFAEK